MSAPCVVCGRVFSFNPIRVPSVRLHGQGPRRPLCRSCAEWVRDERARRELPPLVIFDDAYDPVDERDVPFPDE